MLETSDFVHGSAMWSLSQVMSECSLSGRGQGHVSNFYIVDLENFATASRRYTGDIHNSTIVGLFMTPETMGWQWDMVECILFMAHCLRLNLQLHTISLVRTCRISSFCTLAWQLARLLLTRRIARSLGDSWASCLLKIWPTLMCLHLHLRTWGEQRRGAVALGAQHARGSERASPKYFLTNEHRDWVWYSLTNEPKVAYRTNLCWFGYQLFSN